MHAASANEHTSLLRIASRQAAGIGSFAAEYATTRESSDSEGDADATQAHAGTYLNFHGEAGYPGAFSANERERAL